MEGQRFILILTSLLLAAVAESYSYLSPAGPNMCRRLCHRTAGCHSFTFNPQHLSCRLLEGNLTEQRQDGTIKVFTIKEEKDTLIKLRRETCPSTAMIFTSHRNDFICLIRSPITPNTAGYKLLIVAEGGGDIKQLSLADKSVTTYTENFLCVYGMKYVPAFNKIFFVLADNSDKLQMADLSLDKRSIKHVSRNVLKHIGVAEDRIFVFVKGFHFLVKLISISPFGKSNASLGFFNNPQFIAVDMIGKTLYIGGKNHIFVRDYFGNKKDKLKSKGCWWGIIEPYTNWLYFTNDGKTIKRMSLSSKTPSSYYASLSFLAYQGYTCVLHGTLYAIRSGCGTIQIVSYTNSETITNHRDTSTDESDCICCFIHDP